MHSLARLITLHAVTDLCDCVRQEGGCAPVSGCRAVHKAIQRPQKGGGS